MLIELVAGMIISRFDGVLREVILLASFMPMISAVSGNVGLQAAAIVVRGLDTGHISLERWGHAVRRELATAFAIAGVMATVVSLIAMAWSNRVAFGLGFRWCPNVSASIRRQPPVPSKRRCKM